MRVFGIALAILLTSSVARPCTFSCMEMPVCDLVHQAEAIVVAETVELGEAVGEDSVRAKMRAVQHYKSSPLVGETFQKVVSRDDEEVGRQWLVAFLKNEETGAIEPAGGCTDEPVDLATAKLSFLDAWAAGSLQALTQLNVDVDFDDLLVVAESANGRYETISKSGVAYFNGIPPGVYAVSASGPGFEPLPPDEYERVDLLEHGCDSTSIWLETTNRISGVVLGPEGAPVAGASVSLIGSDDDGSPTPSLASRETTDSTGRFVFDREDPGRYWLGVNAGPVNGLAPYPPTFFPGVEDFDDATSIELGAADRLSDLTIPLPRRLQERSIRVKVLWSDGTPAAGARISRLMDWEFENPSEYFSYSQAFDARPANDEGWIPMTVYGSMKYRLQAIYLTPDLVARRGDGTAGESLPIEIKPGISPLDLEVRLRRYKPGLCGDKEFLE